MVGINQGEIEVFVFYRSAFILHPICAPFYWIRPRNALNSVNDWVLVSLTWRNDSERVHFLKTFAFHNPCQTPCITYQNKGHDASFYITGMTRLRWIPTEKSGIRPQVCHIPGRWFNHMSSETAAVVQTTNNCWILVIPCRCVHHRWTHRKNNNDNNNNNNDNNNNRIQRRNSRFFYSLFTALRTDTRSSGPDTIVCKSRAIHQALITCNVPCYAPRGTKGQLRY